MPLISTLGSSFSDWAQQEFDSITTNSRSEKIPYAGASLYVDGHAKIPTESNIVSDSLLYTLIENDITTQGILQIFRASANNVHDINVMMRGVSSAASRVSIANCDTATNWSQTNVSRLSFAVDNTITFEGAGAINLKPKTTVYTGDYVQYLVTPYVNLTNNTNIEFMFRDGQQATWRITLVDSSNAEAYFEYSVSTINVWEVFDITYSSFTNIEVLNLSELAAIRFTPVVIPVKNIDAYVDYINIAGTVGETTNIEMELYDFGSNATPTNISEGTLIPLDEGEASAVSILTTQKRIMDFHIHAGSHTIGTSLTIGNYYGFLIKTPTVGNAEVYGSTLNTQYNSGRLYTINADGSTTENVGALGFVVYAVVDALLRGMRIQVDDSATNTEVYVMCVDDANNRRLTNMLLRREFAEDSQREIYGEFEIDINAERILLTKGGNSILFYIQTDNNIKAQHIKIHTKFHHNEVGVWG